MCDRHVIGTVRDKMQAQGGLRVDGHSFADAPPALIPRAQGLEDMTHTLDDAFPTFTGEAQFSMEQAFNYAEHGFNLFHYRVDEHTGTHIDAPLHFSADGASVDELPVQDLVAPLCVIDIAARATENPDSLLRPEDIQHWVSENGDIPPRACVAMYSGWGEKVNSDQFRNFDGQAQHYPGFHPDAAQMLIEDTAAASIAVDTLSLDYGLSSDFPTHYRWLSSGRFGIECLANLNRVPACGATLVIGAPKHRGGTGGPARIFALM